MTFQRLVLNFPGFEQTSAQAQLERISHGATKTGPLWRFNIERKTITTPGDGNYAIGEFLVSGDDWQTACRIVQFSWNDIIQEYEKAGHPQGLLRNFPKFLAFFADGTVLRYWRASKRYWGFTIFPILLLALLVAIAAVISWLIAAWVFEPGTARLLLTLPGTVVLTLILCKWPGDRLYLLLTINDWGFARDMVNRSNPAIEQRYEEFAAIAAQEVGARKYDEIVISGHSFGSLWAIAAMALALENDAGLLKGRETAFLALGSSLLKIALAPRAEFMRQWTRRVLDQPEIFWHEIQTKDDIIAFYKADPFAALGISRFPAKLRIDRVNYKKAMDKKRYRSMRKSFYRTHRQYILYQDRPVWFDYMLRLFGPLTSRAIAENPDIVQKLAASQPSEKSEG